MISSVLPVHIITAIVGVVLFGGCLLIWLAGWFPFIRRELENIFTPKQDLFSANASYTGTVQFFRWCGWFLGALLVLPTFIVVDIFLAAVTFLLWRYLAKRAQATLMGE